MKQMTDPDKQKHSQVVYCTSCGAMFPSNNPRCPYCGTMNLPAAEAEYMNTLKDLRHQLSGLNDLTDRKAKKMFHLLRRKLFIAVLFLAVMLAAIYGVHIHQERKESENRKNEYLWQREAFAQLNEYYSAEDYDSLAGFYQESVEAGHTLYAYPHSSFCEFLLLLEQADQSFTAVEEGYGNLASLFLDEFALYSLEDLQKLSEDEKLILSRRRTPFLEDFENRFHISDADLLSLRNIRKQNGFVSYKDAEQFLAGKGLIK